MQLEIDVTLLAEISRRQIQQRFFCQAMGGLIPEVMPITGIQDVLEPMCGPGAWAIDAARAYPRWQITGTDADATMLRIAAENSYSFGLGNLLFQRCEAQTTLPYATGSFDLVQMQNVNTKIRSAVWPKVIHELLRVLRPGGWLHLVDLELGPVSSPALTTLSGLAMELVARLNHENEMRQTYSSALQYPRWLAEAGCLDVKYTLYPVRLGGFEEGEGISLVLARLAEDSKAVACFKQMKMVEPNELERLLKDVRREIQEIDFCGSGMLISVTATKPR